MPDLRPILVGEANPYGGDPRYALYPLPENSAGGRLCRLIMQLDVRDYLRRFDRRNLCSTTWRIREAREAARAIGEELRAGLRAGGDPRRVVLLGSKVCQAFGADYRPFTFREEGSCNLVILPHPSGINRIWNEPGSFTRARAVLRLTGVMEVLHAGVA